MFFDKISFYPGRRWAVTAITVAFFLVRMYIQRGYAALAYLLGLFYLNKIMLFLAPADDPDQAEGFEMTDKESMLPTRE